MLLQYHINIKSIQSKAQRRTLVLPSFIVHFCVFKKREMAPKRSCCIPFSCCCFSSSSSSDEKRQVDHPTSAGARSSPSATDNTIETLPRAPKKREMAPKRSRCIRFCCCCFSSSSSSDEKGQDQYPTSAGAPSSPSATDNTIDCAETLPGAPKSTEAPIPGSSNVVTPSSGSLNVPVDTNLNVSGAPSCNEAPSSSSSSSRVATTSSSSTGLIHTILHKDIEEVDEQKVAVNIDELMNHISELLKLREEEMLLDRRLPNPSSFPWPDVRGLKKLKDILSSGTDLKNLKELLSSGLEVASELKDNISGPITTVLKDIGQASVATAGLLVVAYTLERFHDVSTNREKCWDLIKEMSYVATVVKRLNDSPKGTQEDVIEQATALVVEGAIICCTQIGRSAWKSFFTASKDKDDLSDMRQKLNVMYNQINIEIGLRVLTAIECQGRSPLSKRYPTHAVGMDEPIKEVLRLLEIESEKNAVTVILHGFGGMGKTTLADAVFSHVGGCKYSKVRLFEDRNSTPVIEKLQKQILVDLMEPGEPIPEIRTHEDGQRELEGVLVKIHAFIYVDNVLQGDALKKLLPCNMNAAKKVRILLTARNQNVKNACPLPCTEPQIYEMKGIKDEEAMIILQKEIKEGISDIQFKDIIQTCGGIPLMLTLTAPFIGRAPNKQEAYNTLKEQKYKLTGEDFQEMRYAFAYDALPHDCRDPFLDICSYFKGWDWHTVEDIVGKDELKMLESRAIVTRTTNGVASVHDIILTLARQKSEEESQGKQVRLSFTSARELMAYLEDKKEGAAEGIKGIWLSDNNHVLQISASTLDSMHNSLRVLQLGKLTEVEGKCSKIFEKLVFFEAKVRQLPFLDVSKLKQLRYLSYAPNELKLSKMPSSLRHMEFDGSSHSQAFQISSKDFQQHEHLRILRLVNFSELKILPEELGDQVKGLQELSLSNCKSIEKLPYSISKLPFLRILKMDNCSNLTELPVDFGSLSSLQELNLFGCEKLKALPDSVHKLSSLKLLNLSNCKSLSNLPQGLGKLTGLVELHLVFCHILESIPDSIGELKLLTYLDLKDCITLKELPDGFCNLSFIKHLSFTRCYSLEKLPDGFGQLKSLKVLYMSRCDSLQKLPEGFGQLKILERLDLLDCSELRELCNDFHCLSSLQQLDLTSCKRLEKLPDRFGQLKSLKLLDMRSCTTLQKLPEGFGQLKNLERLDLGDCMELRELCNDFHCLFSLQQLDLTWCVTLEKLPLYFHCLNSLQFLCLVCCYKLEVKSMDHVAKMNTLQVVDIRGSNELVKRWEEIQSDCRGSLYQSVIISGEETTISENVNENMKTSVLSELDRLLTNGRGEPVHLSHLLPNTSTLLIFDDYTDEDQFPWPLIEETVDDGMQLQIIYIGPHFDQLPTKVKDTIFKVHLSNDRTRDIINKVAATIGIRERSRYVQMDAKMVGDDNSDNYGPSSCWRFLTKGELEEFVVCNCRRYLRLKQLADEEDEESNIRLLIELFAPDGGEITAVFQKNESSQKDRTENSERKTTTCGVDKLKGKTILVEMWPYNSWRWEINYHQFWKEVYFMEKDKVDLEIISIPIVYPSKECDVIDVYKQFSREVPWPVLQNSWTVITRAVKFFFEKHGGWEERDEREKWYPTINWIIEPNGRISVYRPSIFLKEEWEQRKNMSTLQFLFNHTHLKSVSAQVQKLMLPGKLICLYRGGDHDEQVLYSIWNALDQRQRDRIHIIHLGRRKMESFQFTMNSKKDYYYPLKNTVEIKGMSSLNLSENEILRFSLRLCHLEKEINRMEDSELKFLLHFFQPLHSFQDEDARMYGSIAFMDGGGKVVAALGGKILESIFDRKDRAERFIKSIMNDIVSASATVEQQNMDAYFDSLLEYISERLEVEFYHSFRFNKEGRKRSLLRVTWPTSRGFCRLKNFLSEGINDDWVKHVISGHPEERDKRTIVIHSLLKGIEEALWAVAGLLVVADLLERLETISANRIDYLFVVEKMFRVAQYSQQFNQKPELWPRGVKRVATAVILAYSIKCCSQIDESNFALFRKDSLYFSERKLRQFCDSMDDAINEGPSNESGSLLEEMCDYFHGFRFWLESGDEGGPSFEGESGVEGGSTAGTSGQ